MKTYLPFKCQHCGKTFSVAKGDMTGSIRKFCSVGCFNIYQSRAEVRGITCMRCGFIFQAKQDHGRWPKFCSRVCYGAGAPPLTERVCKQCAGSFSAKGKQSFCSVTCRFKYREKRREKVARVCKECGKPFQVSQYLLKHTPCDYCSTACSCRGLGKLRVGIPRAEEYKVDLSRTLLEKWASGTRRPNPPEMYKTEKMRAVAVAFGKLNKPGRVIPVKWRSAKGTNHFNSKFWILIAPDRSVIAGVNLSEIVRRHADLFDPKDLKTCPGETATCTPWAARALGKLFRVQRRKGKPYILNHWKGWRAAESATMINNVPDDHEVMLKPRVGSGHGEG